METDKYCTTLRFWSDSTQLVTIAESLEILKSHIHFKGLPIRLNGQLKDRIAKKHYACFEGICTDNWSHVEIWITDTLRHIERENWLVDLLQSNEIEACIWVEVIGPALVPFANDWILAHLREFNISLHIDNPISTKQEN